jgi:hypothetical protein
MIRRRGQRRIVCSLAKKERSIGGETAAAKEEGVLLDDINAKKNTHPKKRRWIDVMVVCI